MRKKCLLLLGIVLLTLTVDNVFASEDTVLLDAETLAERTETVIEDVAVLEGEEISVEESITEENEDADAISDEDISADEFQESENQEVWEEVAVISIENIEEVVSDEVLTEDTVQIIIDENNFPDDIFRDYIIDNFDTDSDGYLSTDEIDAVTEIEIGGTHMASMEGIEYFTSLQILLCNDNHLKSLDVSNNTKLTYINCCWNNITALDVSNNPNLL
ncbi:MAG: hypothetical protein LUI87_04200 [Lachnospiraceae bacterium]|nr:hypothetical protein [Lachnospiraceae bacterium]